MVGYHQRSAYPGDGIGIKSTDTYIIKSIELMYIYIIHSEENTNDVLIIPY